MVQTALENNSLGLTPQEATEIQDKARWLRRVANPYIDFYLVVAVGAAGSPETIEAVRNHRDKQIRDHARDLTPAQLKIYAEDFEQIIGTIPVLKDRLESNESSQIIRKIVHKVQSVADQAKQSDTKNIKKNLVLLIPKKYFPADEDGSATVNGYRHIGVQNPDGEKSWRGWKNPVTARLLCPIEYVEEFKNDPADTMMKLRQGELRLNDNTGDPKFPAFLYDEDAMNGTFTTGLLRGPLLLAVYTSIFISPSAATGAKASLKRGNARIHGMEKVIPSTICYAAIHAYVALCCLGSWGEEWKGVKLSRLYLLLREQFVYPDDPWCTETLKWWNEKTFGGSAEIDNNQAEETWDTQGPSTREQLDNERRGRMAATTGV